MRSVLILEGITIIHLNPKLAQNIASEIPILPEVASIIVSPGLSVPLPIAIFKIQATGLSLTDPPGFKNSALPHKVPFGKSNLRRGVFPTVSIRFITFIILNYPTSIIFLRRVLTFLNPPGRVKRRQFLNFAQST